MDYTKWLGHQGTVAARKAGNKPGWAPFKITRIGSGNDVLISGAVPTGKRRDGRPKWTKPFDEVCVTEDELRAEKKRYEAETGNCALCEGSAQQFSGWSIGGGNRYEPCRVCRATGKAVRLTRSEEGEGGR